MSTIKVFVKRGWWKCLRDYLTNWEKEITSQPIKWTEEPNCSYDHVFTITGANSTIREMRTMFSGFADGLAKYYRSPYRRHPKSAIGYIGFSVSEIYRIAKRSRIKIIVKKKDAPVFRNILTSYDGDGFKNKWTERTNHRTFTFIITGSDDTIDKIRTDMQDITNSTDHISWYLKDLVGKKTFQSLQNALREARTDERKNHGLSISEVTRI